MRNSARGVGKAVALGSLSSLAIILVGGQVFWVLFFRPAHEYACLSSCQSNLRQLQLGATAYAMDWDGHLPPRPTEGDWIARRWEAYPLRVGLRWRYKSVPTVSGPFDSYVKNAGIYGCPSDPKHWRGDPVRSSYEWNYALAGKLLEDVPGKPLAWDRAPFHRHGRNLVWTDTDATRPKWLPEQDFQALELIQR